MRIIGQRRPCSECGEMIMRTAKICHYCRASTSRSVSINGGSDSFVDSTGSDSSMNANESDMSLNDDGPITDLSDIPLESTLNGSDSDITPKVVAPSANSTRNANGSNPALKAVNPNSTSSWKAIGSNAKARAIGPNSTSTWKAIGSNSKARAIGPNSTSTWKAIGSNPKARAIGPNSTSTWKAIGSNPSLRAVGPGTTSSWKAIGSNSALRSVTVPPQYVKKPISNTAIFSILTAICVTFIGAFLLFGSSTKPTANSHVSLHSANSNEFKQQRIDVAPPSVASAAPVTHTPTRDDTVHASSLKTAKAQPEIEAPRTKPADAPSKAVSAKITPVLPADVRAADLRARAEREAQVDLELQNERVHGVKSEAVASAVSPTIPPKPDTTSRAAVLPARTEPQLPGDRGLQETDGLDSAKSDVTPPVSPADDKSAAETSDFIDGITDGSGSLGRYALKKSELERKRKLLERQTTDEKETTEKTRSASVEVWKARLATAEINRTSLIENRPTPAPGGTPATGTVVTPENSSDVAQWESLIKRADAEIDLCKRELRRLEEARK